MDSVPSDSFFLETIVLDFGQKGGLVSNIDFSVFRLGPEIHGKSKANLVFFREFFLRRCILKTELVIGFVHHIFKFFLYIFHHFGFFPCPFSSKLNIDLILSLFIKNLFLEFEVSHFKGSLRSLLSASVMHVLAFVCLLVCSYIGHGCSENFMFWGEFVLSVFGWLFLLWFLRLFAKTAEILFRLAWVLGIVLLALSWRLALLSFGWRLAFHSAFFILLALFTLLWLFLLLFRLVFGRHGVKHSRRFLSFLSINKGCDIDDFSLILVEPSQWNLQVGGSRPVPKIVWLHDTGDKLRGDLWLRFFLDWLFGNFASYFVNFLKVTIVLSHFIPDLTLIPALLNKPTLLLVPFKDFTQSLYLILTSFNLSKIRNH